MEDQDIEESSDAEGTSASSHSLHDLHSEDSRNSNDSYLFNNDDPMEEIRYDDWGSDVYCNESTEDDSKYETCQLINPETIEDQSVQILSEHVSPPVVDVIDETLEENNNDPNNNMDSIELIGVEEAAGVLHDSAAGRSRQRESPDALYVDRAHSPKPGCSKDSQPVFAPLPYGPPSGVSIMEKSRYILGLVSKIHLYSIVEALGRNKNVPIEELKLWDLIPEEERPDYSDVISSQEKLREKASESAVDATTEMQWAVTNNGAKRGPADDICTVQPKKSSSNPDLSIDATSPLLAPPWLPRVASSSEIANLPPKPINRGAIPKVRDVPAKQKPATPIQTWNALVIEAHQSLPINDISTRPVSTIDEKSEHKTKSILEETHVEQQMVMSLDANAMSSDFVVKAPFLKYRATKSAVSRANNTEPEKSKASSVGGTRLNSAPAAAVPMHVQRKKEMEYRTQQPQQKSAANRPNITEMEESMPFPVNGARSVSAPVTAASMHVQMRKQLTNCFQGMLAAKPVVASTSAAANPDHQQRPKEIGKQLVKPAQLRLPVPATVTPKPVAASMPVTAVPKHQRNQMKTGNRLEQPAPTSAPIRQQRQMETGNRLEQPVPATAPIHQQRKMETGNRLEEPAPSTASIHQQRKIEASFPSKRLAQKAAGPSYQQMPREMDNHFQLPAPLHHPSQAANLELPTQTLQGAAAASAPVKEQSTKRIICKEMYYKLRNIFPNVDRKYIKKLCPPDWGPENKDAQMAPIIEHLLEVGETLPQEQPIVEIINDAQNVSYKSADELYEFFIGIFPDADPHYLRDFAVGNLCNNEAIKNFVDSNLERREYPTRKQYMARLKITEQQRQYTTGFEIKQFLSIIPDPSKHFMDAQRKCTHQTVAFEFLKSHFRKLRVATISRVYTQNRYNLSLAAQNLESLPDELKSKRPGYEMPTADVLLLQEIAFVKHKEEINKYIARLKQEEEDEFRTLKAINQLLECQCCFDSECVPSKCSECDNGHVFCNSCVVTGTSTKMGEDQTRIFCFINCGSEFSLSVLQRVLAPTTFSILLKKRQAAEVIEAGLDGLVSCPFCHFASIPPEGDKIFKCLNPECTKESCRLCKELSHVPLKCDEIMKTENARHYIEEKMTQALARKCYKCQRAFFKEEGCNKITCPCGAIMCYLCDKPIKDYTHFRGQGSNNTSLCPLYSDTIRLDAVAVRKVAEEAQKEMLKRNPNINIDTTRLLPDIPRARTGPHNDIVNADELPRRALHVLDLPPL